MFLLNYFSKYFSQKSSLQAIWSVSCQEETNHKAGKNNLAQNLSKPPTGNSELVKDKSQLQKIGLILTMDSYL